MSLVIEKNVGCIRVITLNHQNRSNPFSEDLENSIKRALANADTDAAVKAIVVTGGPNRSFSAGGDFNEVRELRGGEDVDKWIDRVTDLYLSVLRVHKPTVAAIDGYAIGMGFQFSMMFDWRVAASTAEFRMPELKHGIGCSVGVAILQHAIGFTTMQEIVFACDSIPAEKAARYGIINELVDADCLLEQAISRANALAEYPEIPYRATKHTIVSSMEEVLMRSAQSSKEVHRAAFSSRSPHAHFDRILRNSHHHGHVLTPSIDT
ncbi:enoyl-CoA hydratase/isomerase family protein [Paraburkholderia sp. MM5384-R2]|uniref:enoyl-CoA hydratase/isomerase family protein n=1 Tax=Paraburkholderia sp. MM5384-R2 TaxID=2723097 RepID=UPI00181CE744|nr:enoyl-CoA hydratase/isomerase family protein [Paraburkholderia sp. MM5384-R2]MBB5503128.1 carboxymethylproline synthase [Paraburkholderia sp. MM5384-R2]